MSLHDPRPPRKPRRLGLYLPFILLVLAIAAWSGFWLWAKGEATARLDAAVADLNRMGYQVSWKDRAIGGYPFRLNVTLTQATVREPSGWGLEAPLVEGEAYMYALNHWLLAAPQGLTFVRPIRGPVAVKGRILRASLGNFDKHPPSFSFEGVDLAFQPAPGAQPFALSAAQRVEFHLRAGPDDQGAMFARVDDGRARLAGLFARIAGDKPITILWNATLTKMSAFHGADWPSAVRRWAEAGGQMIVRDGSVTAGEAVLGSKSGTLSVGADGRLRGTLDVALRQAPRALGAMGESGVLPPGAANAAAAVTEARQGSGDTARAALTFQAGQTTLGPVAIGPAPKVYELR